MIFTVVEKPDDVSWDAIAECQQIAHRTNHLKGIDQLCSHLNGEQLKEKVGDGICYVAIDSARRVIGMAVLQQRILNTWYYKGPAALHSFEAIIPEWRGKGVYKALYDLRECEKKKRGLSFSFLTTAENNKTICEMYKRKGFRKIALTPSTEGANYYSVVLANWENGCPWTKLTCSVMFFLSYVAVKTIYKPGRIRRL